MEQIQTEELMSFLKNKKNALIAAAAVAFVAVMAVLSINYLNDQRQIASKRAFGEALIGASDRNELTGLLRSVAQEHRGSAEATYALMLVGQNLIEAGEYREAVSVLEQALGSRQTAPFLTAVILESKATALEFNGSLDDAVSTYERALSLQNNFFRRNETRLKLALLNLRMGNTVAAQKHFELIVSDASASDRISRIARNELAALEL